MKIALTGTPGTGKTVACSRLKGIEIVDLRKLAEAHPEKFRRDTKRDTLEVDPKILQHLLPKAKGTIIYEGHLSHLLDVDLVIVLRCSPKVLEKRLKLRKWPEKKVRENLEAEAVDVILVEALDSGKTVLEIDTTELTAARTAKTIMEIIEGERRKYRPGDIDWSDEVMGWY